MGLTNVFKNIRTLDISKCAPNYDKQKFKINLPKLTYLSIYNTSDLEIFTGLKLLRRIDIEKNFDIYDKIAEVFDPSKILILKISNVINSE